MGTLALLGSLVPGLPNARSDQIVASRLLGVGAVVVGLVGSALPWERWNPRATLALALIAFGFIASAPFVGGAGSVDYLPYTFATYYVLVFVWIGLAHERFTAVALAPVAVLAYTGPLALAPDYPRIAVSSAWVVIPICLLVGETVSWAVNSLRRARLALEDAAARLAHDATHDDLTQLPNAKVMRTYLDSALARAGRAGTKVAVLFIDLDRFKEINDLLGHEVGDTALAEVGARLRAAVRAGDLCARLGGDEFAVACEGIGTDEVLAVAVQIHDCLHRPLILNGAEFRLGASIGVALGGGGETNAEILRRADAAMYRAKAAGRSRTEIYAGELDSTPPSAGR